jgi:hypothetical protein
VDQQRDVRENAPGAVEQEDEGGDENEADEAGVDALRMASAPRSAPTVRSSMTVSLAGRAPARSMAASVLAVSVEKLPEIWPAPPVIGSRMTGALSTLSSRTMAKGLPTFWRVISAKRVAPALSKRKLTTGCELWSKLTRASDRRSPEISTRSRTG